VENDALGCAKKVENVFENKFFKVLGILKGPSAAASSARRVSKVPYVGRRGETPA
jgi:hypothetical protein